MQRGILFYIKYPRFLKLDKNKCPKTKIQKNFPQKYSLLYNKLKYLLKEDSAFVKENIAIFEHSLKNKKFLYTL